MYWSRVRSHGCRARLLLAALTMCMLPGVADAQDFRGGVGREGHRRIRSSAAGRHGHGDEPGHQRHQHCGHERVRGVYAPVSDSRLLYRVSAELQGFKKVQRDNVEVRVGDRLEIDFKLEVGGIDEAVNVAADTPLLDTRSGSAGQVIDEKRIALMPLSDGNPFVLARLAPGVAYHGDLKFSRPFDNGGTSDFTADGGPGRNEFTLDGSPNMANGRRVAFVPPAGAVQEFKVETATFDAQQGHTAGATVNVTLKSGTNKIQGRRLLPLSRREAVGGTTSSSSAPAGRRTSIGLQALRLHRRRAGRARQALRRPRQDVLLHRLRVALRHVPGAGPVHGADRGAAQRRLLGAPLAGHRHLRSADRGAPRRRPRRAAAVPRQHHPGRTGSARSPANYIELLPDAQPGRRRARASTTTSPPTRAATTSTR